MKRTVVLLFCLLSVSELALVIVALRSPDANAPRFVPMRSQPTGPYRAMIYDWWADVPIQGGKLWTTAIESSTELAPLLV